MWIKFKYERLPSFCFYCGMLGHSEKFCEKLFDDKGKYGTRLYDGSLRAPVKKQPNASANQWLRNAEGIKLDPRKMEAGDETPDGNCQSGKKVPEFRESREDQRKFRDADETVQDTDMSGYGKENSNDGIIISKQKRV